MLLDQAIHDVPIQLVNVPAMLDIREPNVMLLVVVIPLVQAALNAVSQQVNVLAKQDTQEQHVILVLQITTEQVMELVHQYRTDTVSTVYSRFSKDGLSYSGFGSGSHRAGVGFYI